MNMHKHHLQGETPVGVGADHQIWKDGPRKAAGSAPGGMTSNSPAREDALPRSPGTGARSAAGAPARTPYLGQWSEAAGSRPRPAAPERIQPERRAPTLELREDRTPEGAPSATRLLTPPALLIDVNGSLRSRRNLFLVIWKFQVKKKKKILEQQWAPCSRGCQSALRPQAASTSEPAPNLLPRGPKINPKPERPGAQADKDFTSGRAGAWLCFESGNVPVALQRGGPTCCLPPKDSFRTSPNPQVLRPSGRLSHSCGQSRPMI